MKFDYVEQWSDSRTGRRPEEYYHWKEKMTAQAVELLATVEPFHETALHREKIAYLEAGSPLTIRDYYGTPRGALYGMHRSSVNPMLSSLSTRTRLSNLYLTGQDVNFHGLIGVSLTAILTAEAIVGRNTIVKKL
jgi:all-trans-retinol 13,14-reductase